MLKLSHTKQIALEMEAPLSLPSAFFAATGTELSEAERNS